jgi:hypothetical protein
MKNRPLTHSSAGSLALATLAAAAAQREIGAERERDLSPDAGRRPGDEYVLAAQRAHRRADVARTRIRARWP